MNFNRMNSDSVVQTINKDENITALECMGVSIGITSNNPAFQNRVEKEMCEILPLQFKFIGHEHIDYLIKVTKGEHQAKEWIIYFEDEEIGRSFDKEIIYDLLVSRIRATVAEFTKDYVFLHAGAVSWKNKVLILPGKSRAGKTTLISELIRRGWEYFSDEFAILDNSGLVHPFTKKLSVRGIIDEHRQKDLPVESFGGRKAVAPLPAAYILLTNYKENLKRIKIKTTSAGSGVMANLANSISIRQNPSLVLEVLSVIASQTLVIEGNRGEAAEFADFLTKYLEKNQPSKLI